MASFFFILFFIFFTISESNLNIFSKTTLFNLPLKQFSGGNLKISLKNNVIIIKNKKQFDDELIKANKENKLIVIDFSAKWCPPCQIIGPKYDNIAKLNKNLNIIFLKVDVDEVRELVNQYQIRSMPTFLFMNGKNEIINRFSGANIDLLNENIQKSLEYMKNKNNDKNNKK